MIKTYTIHSATCKEISPGKGSVIWLLSDEQGVPRKVSGIAELDAKGAATSIQAIYSRETPLIEMLQRRQVNETFTIDFSDFNKEHTFVEREAYQHMRRNEQVQGLSANAWKVMWGIIILGLLALAYTGVSSIASMKDNFSGTPLHRVR